jgi:hypothetical protein
MPRRPLQHSVAAAVVLLAGCGLPVARDGARSLEDGVPIEAKYDVIVDKGHSLSITIDAAYRPYASAKNAEAGFTDMFLEAQGTVTYENKSPDKALRHGEGKHELAYMLPFDACVLSPVYANVIRARGLKGKRARNLYCPVKITSLVSPDLEPGQSVTQDLEVFSQDQPVAAEDAEARQLRRPPRSSPAVPNGTRFHAMA